MTASEMFGVPIAGHGPAGPPARQGDQFRHHLWHLGLRPCQPARHLREEAGDYIKTYFQRFPGIRDYMDETQASRPASKGYVETIFGRRCHFPRITSPNASERAFMERAAINAPIQGAAADIIRRAMIRMQPALDAAKLSGARCCCRCMTN